MKITFSGSIFFTQKFGGISRYFINLTKEILKKNHEVKIISPINKNFYLKEIKPENKFSLYFKKYPNLIVLKKANRLLSEYFLKKSKLDIFHETYYEEPSKYSSKLPKVITIYDLIHEKFSKYYSKEQIEKKKKIISMYDHFICISENTKNDLINIYSVPENKTSVIYLAGNHLSKFKKNIEIPEKDFLLYVGSRDNYKNFKLLLNFFKIKNKNKNLKLICFGGNKFSSKEEDYYKSLNIFHVQGDDSLLSQYYQKAICLIIPSKYEGFGITALESMELGCPVLTSNTSVLQKEVIKDAGIFFNPDSIEELDEKIKLILNDSELRSKMIFKGFLRTKQFSWKKCAEDTLTLYKNILK